MNDTALDVRELSVSLKVPSGVRRLLDRVTLRVRTGRTFALLGESGSGKTLLFQSLLGLHSGLPGVVGGQANLLGVDLFRDFWGSSGATGWGDPKDERTRAAELRRRLSPLLGRAVTLVPQDPLTSLPPFYTVGHMLEQAARMGRPGRPPGPQDVGYWLARVHMYGVGDVARRFVHELSGGMAQRVALALALAPGPNLVVADEPTTGLDATLRVKIIELLSAAVEERGVTLCVITHDLEAARLLAKDVAILCAGRVVEAGSTEVVLDARTSPKHPYTSFLLEAERRLIQGGDGGERPVETVGREGTLSAETCGFRSRCCEADSACDGGCPDLVSAGEGHWIACPGVFR